MISEATARRIASEWHSGQKSALYSFASTGHIQFDPDYGYSPTVREVESEIDIQNHENHGTTAELRQLLKYLTNRLKNGAR